MTLKPLALLGLCFATMAPAFGIVLYDRVGQAYDAANGDWDGLAGLQVGQRVTAIAGGTTITSVTGRFLFFLNSPRPSDMLVQVFEMSGDTVGALIGAQRANAATTYRGVDNVFGLEIYDVETTVSVGGLAPGGQYLIVGQPHGESNFGYLARKLGSDKDNYLRDYSEFGKSGGYGFTDWRESGDAGFGRGDANMAVEAVPEPGSIFGLATGLIIGFYRRCAKQ